MLLLRQLMCKSFLITGSGGRSGVLVHTSQIPTTVRLFSAPSNSGASIPPPPPHFDAVKSAIYKKIAEAHRHPDGPWPKMTNSIESIISGIAEDQHPPRLLDLATGPGEPAMTIAKKFPHMHVIATDISEDQVQLAGKTSSSVENMSVCQANMENLEQFESNHFDIVTCCYGFMFPPDIPKAIAEAHRVMKPGGYLVATTWNKVSFLDLQQSVLSQIFSEDEIPIPPINPLSLSEPGHFESLLQTGGFESVETSAYTYPFEFGSDPEYRFQASFMVQSEFLEERGAMDQARSIFEEQKEMWGSLDASGNYIVHGSEYKMSIAKKSN